MSHFWLKSEEQVLMHSATSTAHDYGYIGAFDMGTATKKALLALLGYEARPEDQIRPHKLVNWTKFWIRSLREHMSAKVLVRMNKRQAMVLKLKHQPDSVEARFYDDPTGEFWGNLLITRTYMPQRDYENQLWGYQSRTHVISALGTLINGNGFGPTLDRVADFADPLPEEWRAAFVRVKFATWEASKETTRSIRSISPLIDGMTTSATFNDLFEESTTLRGQRWATQFWQWCQEADYRKQVGIE